MPHPLVIKRWLYKADQDFGFASTSLENGYEYYDQPCFFFQQAAEKYLKAYTLHHNLRFEKTHDLLKLLEICKENDIDFEELKGAASELNTLYIEPRYADAGFKLYTKEETLSAQVAARKIQQFVRKKLGVEREITTEEMKATEEEADKQFQQFEGK
ncbi:MAG: HEPN domain-containing protein [Candidatus Cloacimonetes bacterium]|nr:HEPN domain-containing protein [Candidatus Cloacimonadota bacterium]